MISRFPAKTALFTAVSLPGTAALILIAVLAWRLESVVSTTRWIDHSDKVIAAANNNFRKILDDVADFRGYLLTGNDDFRNSYQAKSSHLISQIKDFCSLVSDNSQQAAACRTIEKLSGEWLAASNEFLGTTWELGKAKQVLERNEPILQSLRIAYNELIAHESALRAHRVTLATEARGTLWISIFTSLGLFTILLGGFGANQLLKVAKRYEELKASDAQRLADLQRTVNALNEEVIERRKAEKGLEKSNALLNAIYNHSVDSIYSKDRKGRILTANPATLSLIKKNMDEVRGKTDTEFLGVSPETLAIAETDKRVMESGIPETLEEIPIPGAKERILQSTKCPIRDEQGKVVGLVGITRDITKLKRTQEELRSLTEKLTASNEALASFTAIASHDLREPIRTVSTFLSLFERRNGNKFDAESREYLDHAKKAAERMGVLVGQLLKYAQVEGEAALTTEVSLSDAVNLALMNLKALIDESRAQVTQAALPTISGDRTQLVQLFQNLFSNAIKYRRNTVTPEIHVSVESREKEWLFCVRDNGMGFEMSFAQEIFRDFRRLHRREVSGTGLGLSICKTIVSRHGGEIWAESVLGTGSSFFFTLPKSARMGAAMTEEESRKATSFDKRELRLI